MTILRTMRFSIMAGLLCAGALPPAVARADSVSDFYRGKTIRVYVAVGTGAYDLYARMLLRHMPQFVPGQPTMIVNNMPGGGGVIAANYIANVAPKDGTALLVPLKPVALTQLLSPASVKYNAADFRWIGSMVDAPGVVMLWSGAAASTIDDARKMEVMMGSTGWGGETAMFPSVLNAVLGTRFKVVAGFKGMSDIFLAMERGEMHGVSTVYGSVKGLKRDWVEGHKVKFLVQVATHRDKELPDVPTVLDLAKNDDERRILRFLTLSNLIGRSIAAHKGVPAERLAALRKAFDQAVASPGYLKEAGDGKIYINSTPGQKVQEEVDEIFRTPKSVVDRVSTIMSAIQKNKR